ncbi:MAG: hypothetical protein ACRCT8_15220 [Lacipirellulaceae bacterium]
MDQIRVALAWLKAQHFWVLTLLATILATAAWYVSTGSLATQFKANQAKIGAEFTSQDSLQSKAFKANDPVNAAQEEQIQLLADGVRKVWNQLYDRQKEDVLKWPVALGEAFVTYIEDKRFGDALRDDHRERYLNYIQKQFPKLLEIIDARELAFDGASGGGGPGIGGGIGGSMGGPRGRGGATGGMGMGMGMGMGDGAPEEEDKHRTEWADQTMLRDRMNLKAKPSAIEVWVLQEDLWVYEALLRAIARTNDATGSSRRSNMAIRTIYELQVGRAAAATTSMGGRLVTPSLGGAGMAAGDDMMGDMGMGMGRGEGDMGMGMDGGMGAGGMDGGMGMGMGMEGGEGGEGADPSAMLLANRYLDPEGKPIAEAGEGATFGVEYKRLPVRMMLGMDQRWLTRFIAELGNGSLQVEVEQVRINPSDSGGGMGGGSGMGGASPPPRMAMTSGQGESMAFDREPSLATVILHGIVTIFNEPDDSVLDAGGDPSADATAGL